MAPSFWGAPRLKVVAPARVLVFLLASTVTSAAIRGAADCIGDVAAALADATAGGGATPCASLIQRQASIQRHASGQEAQGGGEAESGAVPGALARGRAHAAAAEEAHAAHYGGEDAAEVGSAGGGVCVHAEELPQALRESTEEVLSKGLPEWPKKAPGNLSAGGRSAKLAFLVQLSVEDRLSLVRRVFDRLYSPGDVFLYLVDSTKLASSTVRVALGLEGPKSRNLPNVRVQESPHAGYYYWPRVQVVLDGMTSLLEDDWDFVIHLSETDYPVHSIGWLRNSLSNQRQSSFIQIQPRCTLPGPPPVLWEDAAPLGANAQLRPSEMNGDHEDAIQPELSSWYWWTVLSGVASCGSAFEPFEDDAVYYPMAHLEEHGFIFAHATEWVILTRELVTYATSPGLAHFKRLIGMHAAADEIFWPTLVLNIPNFTQKISRQGWFVTWSPGATDHSPETLTDRRTTEIMEKRDELLFMRKVNEVDSASLLAEVDRASYAEAANSASLAALQKTFTSLELRYDKHRMRCSDPGLKASSAPFPAPAPPAYSALRCSDPGLKASSAPFPAPA
eukprot:CAMPEP_0203847472 /NCGR_PEP_ID=MMETSP0359-20131031/5032_1 /ASSEMBLY_ACC=CAM_ASM_000338 /TAXON_ID=268821 /ORGANISM="Scrippsiella Hangoei, Strain SHTV-5" /LENGTH=562 /DNA_ID=CAMNT_0050762931 /DNA_START=83 /DNA_END=1767 /DNA_ORIENTATION=+